MTGALTGRGGDTKDVGVHREEVIWGQSEKVAICKPQRQVSEEASLTHTLTLDFQPLDLWEHKFKPLHVLHLFAARVC